MNGIESVAENMVRMDLNEFQAFVREQLLNSGGPALVASANACIINASDDGSSVAEIKELIGVLRLHLEGHDFAVQLTSLLLVALSGHLEQEKEDAQYRLLCENIRDRLGDKLPFQNGPTGPGPMYG